MIEFSLDGNEFIQLNALLKLTDIAESGGQANQIITEEYVSVNGELETAKRKKIRPGDIVEVFEEKIQVIE